MTDTQKHDLFMDYVGYKSADVYAEKFGVSPRTIDRYSNSKYNNQNYRTIKRK